MLPRRGRFQGAQYERQVGGGEGGLDPFLLLVVADVAGDRLAQRGRAGAEAFGKLGVAAGMGDELHVEEEGLAVLREALHPLVGERSGAGLERLVLGELDLGRGQLARPFRHVLLEHGEEEVGLAVEVRVDGAVRVARLLGDLLHRGALVAAACEDGGGGGE